MRIRPPDLPDYKAPPVTEVVLGVQFNIINGFKSAHIGGVWEAFRDEFPNVQDQPALAPAYETFGPNPALMPNVSLHFMGAEVPRVFFINRENSQILQVQRDRFIHNWRKVAESDTYPRFEHMLATFEDKYARFQSSLSSLGLPLPEVNQCELTYINQVEAGPEEDAFASLAHIFPDMARRFALDTLGVPEDIRFMVRYPLRGEDMTPVGRIIVSSEPALRFDGHLINQLTFTARGRPGDSGNAGVVEFLTKARAELVRTFRALTDDVVQREKWGRIE